MFNKRSVIGLFTDEDSVADALDKVSESGFSSAEYEILTGTPYPDGTFGDEEPKHKLYRFPIIGAMCGFIVGLLLTAGNQIAFPLIIALLPASSDFGFGFKSSILNSSKASGSNTLSISSLLTLKPLLYFFLFIKPP